MGEETKTGGVVVDIDVEQGLRREIVEQAYEYIGRLARERGIHEQPLRHFIFLVAVDLKEYAQEKLPPVLDWEGGGIGIDYID